MQKLRVLLTGLWLGFIFYQGIQTGEVSIETSDKIVHPLVEMIEQVKPTPEVNEKQEAVKEEKVEASTPSEVEESKANEKLYKIVHYIVRKSAHFFEYAVLAALAVWTFKGFKATIYNQVIYTLFLVLSVAVFDEYFQSFVARTSSVSDVLIDFLGGLTGILIFILGSWITQKVGKNK